MQNKGRNVADDISHTFHSTGMVEHYWEVSGKYSAVTILMLTYCFALVLQKSCSYYLNHYKIHQYTHVSKNLRENGIT